MTSDEELRRIFREVRTIAVVGVSMHDHKPAHFVPRYLQEHGYRIVPVNPVRHASPSCPNGEILGEKVYRRLEDVDVPFDAVEVFRPPAEAEAVARSAVASGARVLWFQLGTHTDEAVRLAEEAAVTVVVDHCMMPEHRRLVGPFR
ncbi:MAG: CoA-binding protein [Actinobacteria bacterium]|nr:MAG: CoA-binding protein [Actinomycetota bacterium]